LRATVESIESQHDATGGTLNALENVRTQLGKPAYARGSVMLFAGDCMALMSKLADSAFGLTVTSPPYNIGKEYESQLSLEAYLDWCESWIGEIHRLTRANGAFWLNLGYVGVPGRAKAIPIPYLLWDRVPFFLVQEVVWNYGAGVAARRSLSPRNEKFLWYVRDQDDYIFNLDDIRDPDVKYPNQRKNGKIKVNPLGKNPTDVWSFPKVTSGRDRSSKERTDHPAQFPLAVVDRIIRASSNPGDLVFDPFMGSGSVAEAAVRLGRAVVGFELEPRYLDIAGQRLDRVLEELGQEALF
jgi:adenine-specific DNA-methyltransferase